MPYFATAITRCAYIIIITSLITLITLRYAIYAVTMLSIARDAVTSRAYARCAYAAT